MSDKKKVEPRYCGRCNGKDTMLFCCECLREIIQQKTQNAQRRIKEELDRRLFFDNGSFQYKDHIINKIFKEEFGGELI